MPDARFFAHAGPLSLAEIARTGGVSGADFPETSIDTAAPLAVAGERSLSFCSDRKYLDQLKATRAAAVFVPKAFAEAAPSGVIALVSAEPQAAWARVAARLHPVRLLDNQTAIHPTAQIEDGATIAPGSVVGAQARIGRNTFVCAHVCIGPGVAIGRDCYIGSGVQIGFALIGDRVRISSGVVIGEPGFGVAASTAGTLDVPQLGRVIIMDGVSIGANSCVDRGAWEDTILGENTKIDNLVQIAHNVVLGRNCVLAAQAGISGSVRVGDGVMFGGRAAIADHLTVGDGARLAGGSGLMHDVPAGETWGGTPAKPARRWFREMAWVSRQVALSGKGED